MILQLKSYSGAVRYGLLSVFLSVAAFGQCTFSVSPGPKAWVDSMGAIDRAGDPLVIQVTASAPSCTWTVDATDGLINANGQAAGSVTATATGTTGNGSVTYAIPVNNTGQPLTATLNVAGNAIALKQDLTATAFDDVLPGGPEHNFFDGINLLAKFKITSGTSTNPPLFSPAQNVSRGQMAVFIIATIFNGAGNFTYSPTPYFTDVPPSSPVFKFVQKMRDLGIAAGTTATTYGPNLPITREQMAVFITLARLGPQTTFTWSPTQQFSDVPPTLGGVVNPFFKFVQKLAEMGITAGCTTASGNTLAQYCPNAAVTRDQMAVFLIVGGFNLLTPNAPIISSIAPNSGVPPSQTITITGVNTHFDTHSPTTTTILPIAGITASTPVVTSATSLTVTLTIPAGTPAGPVSITAETPVASAPAGLEDATAPSGFTIGTGDAVPAITSFTPASGPIGTQVTITGTTLVSSLMVPVTVLVPLQGGGTTAAPVTAATATSLSFVVPSTATTGKITVSSSSGTATSATPFTVVASSTYTISAAPSTANVIAGQSTTYTVTAASTNGFTGLAQLSVTGLPAGVTSSFNPQQITAGQQSTLTISAPANQTTNTANLAITASATVNNIAVPAATTATLNVTPITTSFLGRTVVDNTSNTSIAGVTISMVGQDGAGNKTNCTGSTTSDGSGNFALTNLPATCLGPQLIGFNGNTVTSPAGTYAGLQLVFTLVSNTVVVSPVLIHLPRVDNVETFNVIQNDTADQSYTFKTIPGLSVTVYAGTVLTKQDGTQPNPFPLAAIEVPVDRLPDLMPVTSASVTAFIVAFQPAETNASQAVAVSFPNTLNTPPGTDVPLMTLDPTLGRMAPYGTGTISSDGTTILPDINPATTPHRYGIIHFDWHGPAVAPPPTVNPPCGCDGGDGGDSPATGDPIDLSSGVAILESNDLSLKGNRGSINIIRTYRSLSSQGRAFGIGSSFNYDYRLDTLTPQSVASLNLEFPNGVTAPFTLQADGTMINQTSPLLSGAVLTTAADGTATLRFRNGSFYVFTPGNFPSKSVLTATGDTNGNVIAIVRNPSIPQEITEIDDPAGRKMTFQWNGNSNITSITDPIGRTVSYTYNGAGTVASFTNALGGVTSYTYDSKNNLLTITDPHGIVQAANTYDANGRVIKQVNAAGGVLQYAYVLINALVPTSPVQQTTFTDPLGNVTVYRFNSQGYVIGVTDAAQQTRAITRSSGTNFVLAMTGSGECDVCGPTKAGDFTYTYDSAGNLLTQTDALGNVTTLTYEAVHNRATSFTTPKGDTTQMAYDARGNMTSITDPRGNITGLTYDSKGLLTVVQDPAGNQTTFTYDSQGNLITTTDPLGKVTRYSYDGAGRLIGQMNPIGQLSSLAFNALDQVVTSVDGNGDTAKLQYDLTGYLTGYTLPNGGTVSFTYDSAGRLASRKDQLNRTNTYTYDVMNNLVSAVNRRGQKVTFTYDAMTRPVLEQYADATVARTYDSSGRLTSVVDSAAGTFAMTYDLTGRLTKQVGPFGAVDYTRDNDGRVASRQVEGETIVNYHYDAAGNMIHADMGGTTGTTVDRTFDVRNLLQTMTRSNGVNGTYSFDAVGRILSLNESSTGGSLVSRTLNYDAAGRIVSQAIESGQPLATTAAAATFDAANQIVSEAGATFTHDADGNRLTQVTAAGKTSYTWDARGRLVAIVTPAGTNTDLLYDYDGNLIQKRVISTGSDVIERYVLDDLTNVVAQEQVGIGQTQLLTGRSVDQNWAAVSGTNAVFGLTDNLGSVVALTDKNGAVTGRAYYEPYGATTESGATYPFEYAGRQQVMSGLYYMRSRFYDAQTSRFLSEDPLRLLTGTNFYAYVSGNPISLVDPFGLSGTLTISSSGTSGLGNHSWISYTPDGGTTTTYGTWGNNPNNLGNGLQTNLEQGRASDASRSDHLNDAQEAALMALIQQYKDEGPDGWSYGSPCSTFAADAWHAATGETLNTRWGPISNPTTLTSSIISANGGAANGTAGPAGSSSSSNSYGSNSSSSSSSSGSSVTSFGNSSLGKP